MRGYIYLVSGNLNKCLKFDIFYITSNQSIHLDILELGGLVAYLTFSTYKNSLFVYDT